MDFRLKVFAVTSATLNFTKAAEVLGISQPAVTKHIQELEKEYGIQLFARRGAKLELTYQGKYFLFRAKEILRKYKDLESETSMLKTVFTGNIRIGAPAALYYGVIPKLAADFSMLSPGVKMDLKVIESESMHGEIKSGKIDVGFLYNSKSSRHFFIRDRIVLVSGSQVDNVENEGVEDAEKKNNTADKLNIISYRGDGETDSQLRSLFSAAGFDYSKVNVIAEFDNAKSAIEFLVNSGKTGAGKMINACSFVWRSQVADYLKMGVLHDFSSQVFRGMGTSDGNLQGAYEERIYGIEGTSSSKNSRFMEYASMWGKEYLAER